MRPFITRLAVCSALIAAALRADTLILNDGSKVEGTITEVSAKEFIFNGVVEMRVSHINKGEPCKREGELTFVIKGNRRYWRMQQMDNPCDEAADYVDIYFR